MNPTHMLPYGTAALAAGALLDVWLGDPAGWPHLIRLFGGLIAGLEKRLYPLGNKRLGGTLLVVCTLTVCTGAPLLLLLLAWRLSPWAYFVLETLLVWQLLAARSLRDESLRVYRDLARNDLEAARVSVSRIVGRDTARLDEAGVARAAVETVAENAADGVIAPLFWIALGGGALGCFYKAVNTMDSMIGYQNDRYRDFGTTAARLDDLVNYLPSRLAALLMMFGSSLVRLDTKNARRIWRRDRRKHASPNSAQTEAVMAGALDVQLAGDAYYFGQLHKKPLIGDPIRPIAAADILRAHRLMFAASGLMLLLTILYRGGLYLANL